MDLHQQSRAMGGGIVTLNLSQRRKAQFIETGLTSDMDIKTLNRLMDCATFVNLQPRDVLFMEGDAAHHFYSVVSGYVRLYRHNSDGREADIRVCGPGDSFGDELVFTGDAYRYGAQAAEKATLVCYDIMRVRNACHDDDGELMRALATSLACQLQESAECISGDRLHTALQRVAHYLLAQCDAETSPTSFRLACRKSLLAGKLGLAPEALSRAFATLKTMGVEVHGRSIEIQDVDALKRL